MQTKKQFCNTLFVHNMVDITILTAQVYIHPQIFDIYIFIPLIVVHFYIIVVFGAVICCVCFLFYDVVQTHSLSEERPFFKTPPPHTQTRTFPIWLIFCNIKRKNSLAKCLSFFKMFCFCKILVHMAISDVKRCF
jgi:hypothetical protein